MKHRSLLLTSSALALLAVIVFLGRADTTSAGTFSPEISVTIADPAPEAHSDFTGDFGIPAGDVNFALAISFIPQHWGITPAEDVPIGAVVGRLTSVATLGLINAPCSTALTVEFTFFNGSIDTADTVAYADEDENGTPDFAEDKDGNGLADAVDKYPDILTRIYPGLQPIRRAIGITPVAGLPILLQFLIFGPGTVINANLPSDAELGYPSVTVLTNIGDPEAVPVPNPITDFCAPLTAANTALGISEDNPDTDADEAGHVLLTNPQDAAYTFTTIALGLPDADNDGFENLLDTCPFDVNEGDPRLGTGDEDNDGLDAACDPNDNEPNSDQDGDGYLNRGDNCPLDANGQDQDNQADGDEVPDQIGDACDPPAQTDGEYAFAQPTFEVAIGEGTGEPGPPAEAGGGGDGGLSTGAIIGIIVGVVAGVLVLGGGAAMYMRRRASGGS